MQRKKVYYFQERQSHKNGIMEFWSDRVIDECHTASPRILN